MPGTWMHAQRRQKNRKTNNEKVSDKQKKQDLKERMKNKTYFSVWVFDSDVQNALLFLIFNKHRIWLFLSKCCRQIWGVSKGGTFVVGPGRHSLATPM